MAEEFDLEGLLGEIGVVLPPGDDPLDILMQYEPTPSTTPAKAVPSTVPPKVAPARAAPAKVVPSTVPAKTAPATAAKTAAKPAPAKTAAKPAPAKTAPPAAPVEERFVLSNLKDHVKKKGMWAGLLKPIQIPDLFGAVAAADYEEEPAEDGEEDTTGAEPKAPALGLMVKEIKRAHTPALLKIADEIIVNASDQVKRRERAAPTQRVTTITTTFDPLPGRITVFNDGPGIPVVVHADATAQAGRSIYEPEIAFSVFLAGTNIDKDIASVTGGINGLGAKIASAHSLELNVNTTDGTRRLNYDQTFRERLDVIEPPKITDLKKASHGISVEDARPHTRVAFTPAYAELGYKLGVPSAVAPYGTLSKADADDLDAYLRLRMHQIAAYLGPKVRVSYNGVLCRTTDVASLARLLLTPLGEEAAQAIVLSAQAKATVEPYKLHPWNIAIIILPPGKKAGRRAASQNTTVINGVLTNKGGHVKYIKGMLSAAVEDKLRRATKRGKAAPKTGTAVAKVLAKSKGGAAAKAAPKAAAKDGDKMKASETLAGVRLVMCGAIPGADWGGQRKDELQVSKETLEHYSLTATFLKQVGDAVAERILIAQGAKSAKFVHDKYTKARNAGKASRRHTYLLAAEGDSAITLFRTGLTQTRGRGMVPPGGPSLDWCGIISLQGVVPNAAREVTEVETSDGTIINVRSAKLQNNKRLAALVDALGLRYDCKYTTAEERATLNYGKLVLGVDEDLDGKGKIAPLVLVMIWVFWPALIEAGYVGRFKTDVARAKPKSGGPIVGFAYEEDLRIWLAEDPQRAKTHTIKYYKGLAAHDGDEARWMFTPENFRRSIYTYILDDSAKRLFDVYYGPNPALRKAVLTTPVQYLSREEAAELQRRQLIPIGRVQLDIDAKAYKNDAIKRQIPGAADGLNPARRKTLSGAVRHLNTASKELKVFQLAGYVAAEEFYHHSDDSLKGTIVTLAQSWFGARKYPYLQGKGQFGSCHGDKPGSARYIGVRLSPLVEVTFPPADRWHLPYVFEDGERAEPYYYVPVAPMTALESYKIVSEGWNHDSFGRDLDAVSAVVAAYIGGDPELLAAADRLHAEGKAALPEVARLAKKWHLPASLEGFDGEVRSYRGEPYSFGVASWDAPSRTVTVSQLQMGVLTSKYLETLLKPGRGKAPNLRAEYIEGVEDYSTEKKVELQILLREGAFEAICEKYGAKDIDPLEDFLMLRGSLRPHLNYYDVHGGVLEFGDTDVGYLAALLYWAPLRRRAYVSRLTRERIVAELRILEEEQVLKYIQLAPDLNLSLIEDDEVAAETLRRHGFVPLRTGLLHRPEYTPNETLRELVTTEPDATYDYILNLKERELLRKPTVQREARLVKLREELECVSAQLAEQPIAGASVWRAEYAAFKAVVARGLATDWKFE